MGIISHRDLFTAKYITAEIRDSSGRLHIRHIKHTIGDYWVTDIDGKTYVFKINDARINTYKETAAKSARTLWYSTKHYLPISPEDNKALEETLRINNLPRMNLMMFGSFKLLSQKEKREKGDQFREHNITEMFQEIASHGQKYAVQMENLKQYFDNMAVYKIVTPVREVTEFIEDDMIATDPKYLGDIYNAIQRTDFEHKKVTNVKVDAKKNWILIIGIIAIVGALGGFGFYFISNGGLSNILPNFGPATTGTAGGGKLTDAQVFSQYPTPKALNDAIQSGQLSMDQLSPNMQKMAKSYKPPQTAVTP